MISDKRTLLLVEDNAIIAMSEKIALEKCGYNVILAFTGKEAIDLFDADNYIDLILMDVDLGNDINGP
ncbi:MAG TPA: response regulator [Spirochaetota bacterium]|nr:response regulator [Spirochaetota bacterium]HPS86667.1 response regulator [Spirochaetota bacterium]